MDIKVTEQTKAAFEGFGIAKEEDKKYSHITDSWQEEEDGEPVAAFEGFFNL